MGYRCCNHVTEPFFVDKKEPTQKEVEKFHLYKCVGCKRWYSLLGISLRSIGKNVRKRKSNRRIPKFLVKTE